MTVRIGGHRYVNVTTIEDQQTKKIAVVLILNSGEEIVIPVTENNEIVFEMTDLTRGNCA